MSSDEVASLARGVGPVGHVCATFDHPRDHHAFVDELVRCGSSAGDRVLVVSSDGARTHDARGASEVAAAGSSIDLADTVRLLRTERARARDDGFHALRVMGEMTWLWRAAARPDDFVDFEQALDDEFADADDVLVTCLFDRRRFPEELLARFAAAHHGAVDLTERSGRPRAEFRGVPGPAPGSLVLDGECDLATEDALRDAVASAVLAGRGRLVADLGGLSFASVGSLRALCAPALDGAEVVLERPSRLVGEVLDLLGFADLPGVRVRSVPLHPTDAAVTGPDEVTGPDDRGDGAVAAIEATSTDTASTGSTSTDTASTGSPLAPPGSREG